MDLRILSAHPANPTGLCFREHRLLAMAGVERDFGRLAVRRDESPDGTQERSDKYDNVYDKMKDRQEQYRKAVTARIAGIKDTVKDVDGKVGTASAATQDLIDKLSTIWQTGYTNSSGERVTFKNGLYARVEDMEAKFKEVETQIADLEDLVRSRNGGRLPDGVVPYRQQVQAERSIAALNNQSNASVDIRSYSDPFALESSRPGYQLARIPANFRFPANLAGGNFDLHDGSNGIQYLRIENQAARELVNTTVDVDVYDDTTKIGTVEAAFRLEDQVSGRIKIVYGPDDQVAKLKEQFEKNKHDRPPVEDVPPPLPKMPRIEDLPPPKLDEEVPPPEELPPPRPEAETDRPADPESLPPPKELPPPPPPKLDEEVPPHSPGEGPPPHPIDEPPPLPRVPPSPPPPSEDGLVPPKGPMRTEPLPKGLPPLPPPKSIDGEPLP